MAPAHRQKPRGRARREIPVAMHVVAVAVAVGFYCLMPALGLT